MHRQISILLVTLLGLMLISVSLAAQESAAFEAAECPVELPVGLIEGQNAECGYVTVPEEHANPDGPAIRLAVVRLLSTAPNPQPDPLFMAQGGPGGSTVDLFVQLAPLFAPFLAQRDIILVEQRGTFYSEPNLFCEEILDATIETLDEVLTIEESTQGYADLTAACVDQLRSEGVNLNAFDSVENAADIVTVADALGYGQFNFYGVSYGSLLGLHLIRDHEARLRSVILDAVVPTNFNFIPDVAPTTQRAFDELFATCAADEICNENFPNLETVFFDTVEALDANPVFFSTTDPVTGEVVPGVMTGDNLISLVNSMLYSTPLVPNLPQYIYDTANGDLGWAESLVGIVSLEPAYTFAVGMQFAVLCAEDSDFLEDEILTEGLNPRIAQNQNAFVEFLPQICEALNVEPLESFVDDPVQTELPVLLTSGQFDPITPQRYADIVAENLPNSYNLLFPAAGHGALLSGNCAITVMAGFVSDPTTAPDTSCIGSLAMNYALERSDVNDVFSFLISTRWQDISTDAFVSFEDPQTGAVVSMVSVAADDPAAAIEEALSIILPEFAGIPLVSQSLPVGSREYLQNVYFNIPDVILAFATIEDGQAAVFTLVSMQEALLEISSAIDSLFLTLRFND